MRHFQEHILISPKIGYINVLGTGFGKIDKTQTNNKAEKNFIELYENNTLQIGCKNKKQLDKYLKSCKNNDYFISYQVKNNNPKIGSMKINGIFKNTGDITTVPTNSFPIEHIDKYPEYCEIILKLKRIDIYEKFEINVKGGFMNWNGDSPPDDVTLDGKTKCVIFRGSVGNILDTNYRYRYILDFMQKYKYF